MSPASEGESPIAEDMPGRTTPPDVLTRQHKKYAEISSTYEIYTAILPVFFTNKNSPFKKTRLFIFFNACTYM